MHTILLKIPKYVVHCILFAEICIYLVVGVHFLFRLKISESFKI